MIVVIIIVIIIMIIVITIIVVIIIIVLIVLTVIIIIIRRRRRIGGRQRQRQRLCWRRSPGLLCPDVCLSLSYAFVSFVQCRFGCLACPMSSEGAAEARPGQESPWDKAPLEPYFVQHCPASHIFEGYFVRALSRFFLIRFFYHKI